MEHTRKTERAPRPAVSSAVMLFATFLYLGYLPLIPGTFASAAVLVWFLACKPGLAAVIALAAPSIIFGFACAGKAEEFIGTKDPKVIVIDEIAGMSLSLLFIPHNLFLSLAAFLVFRVLDTIKPFPASRFQNLHGAVGIMLDDLVAAGYTVLVMQAVIRILLRIPG